MAKKELQLLVSEQKILNKIYVVRDENRMLDSDLAEMYGVEKKPFENLRSQNDTSSRSRVLGSEIFLAAQ